MLSAVLQRVAELGVPLPAKPAYVVPQLPTDLAELSPERVMTLFAEMTQWASYLAVQVTKAEIEEHEAEAALKVMEAKRLVAGWGGAKEDRVTLAKAERDADPQVVALRERYDQTWAYRKMIATLADNVRSEANLLSREISKRTGLAPLEARAGSSISSGWRAS